MKTEIRPSDPSDPIDRAEFERRSDALRIELLNAQFELREQEFAVLVLVTGVDEHGVEAVYDRCSEWLDARYVRFVTYHDRDDAERLRPAMWPHWCGLPPRGTIGVHYGGWIRDAVRERLAGELPGKSWRRRIGRIAAFERALVDDGTVLVKLDLAVDDRTLAERAEVRRRWKPDPVDRYLHRERRRIAAVKHELLAATGGPATSWITIDGRDPRRRDLEAFGAIRDAIVPRLGRVRPAPPVPVLEPVSAVPRVTLTSAVPAAEPPEALEIALEEESARLRAAMRQAERREVGVAVVFEGHDAAGKGGAIRRITRALPAYQYEVHPIAAPSEDERRHHWLRRFWTRLPRVGRMAIFDRSWYGRVLVERVEGFAAEADWKRGYGEIVEFERNLRGRGFAVVKFWLEVSPDEQARRFAERKETPYKKYKFTDEDIRNSAKRPAYEAAAGEMFARTSTRKAPWTVLAADDKRAARVAVVRTLRESIERAVRKAR
jgi:polyphosphate kinase 2 (PPK2 family)